MTLSRPPERPIDRLLSKLLDAALDDGEQEYLAEMLERDPQARQAYHEHIALHAMLHWIDSEPPTQVAGEPALLDVAPEAVPVLGFLGNAVLGTMPYASQGWPLAYLVATVIFAIGLVVGQLVPVSNTVQLGNRSSLPATARQDARPSIVGRITGALDCKSGTNAPVAGVGDYVGIGQHIGLDAGLLELTYDTGAKVVLQGPVMYKVESPGCGFLSVGKLTARLEKRGERREERGEGTPNLQISKSTNASLSTIHYPLFTIKTPTAIVTDLGTEFGVEVDKDGVTKSYVFVGAVRVEPADAGAGAQDRAVVLHPHDSVWVQRAIAGAGAKLVVRHDLAEPDQFVRPDQFVTAAKNQVQRRLHGRQMYAEQIRRDPALVVYYDFQRRPESPGVLYAAGPGADGKLDGIIHGTPVRVPPVMLTSDANLLRGKPAEASSVYVDGNIVDHNYPALHLTDSTEMPHVFSDGDVQQRLVIHGFNSPVSLIRIWRSEDRVAQQVTVKSALSDSSSLNAADYDTTLASLSSLSFNDQGYCDIAVKAPAETKSLFFDFGNRTEYYPAGGWTQPAGVRTMEIQAFATAPTFPVPTPPSVWTRGRVPGATALPFDSAGVKVNLPRRLTQMTLAAWLTVAFIDDKCTTCGLLTAEGWGEAGASPERLRWQVGRTGEIYFGTATYSFTTPPVLPWQTWDRNRWRHLAVVADPAQQRLACYLDGKPVHAEKLPESFAGAFGVAGIGSWQSATGHSELGLHGRIDELLILCRAMTDQEIKSLYETGKP